MKKMIALLAVIAILFVNPLSALAETNDDRSHDHTSECLTGEKQTSTFVYLDDGSKIELDEFLAILRQANKPTGARYLDCSGTGQHIFMDYDIETHEGISWENRCYVFRGRMKLCSVCYYGYEYGTTLYDIHAYH